MRRNSIIPVKFIKMRLIEGQTLAEAVIEAGMIRLRPIMLTAVPVVAGATVILTDPIFQGLESAMMAGTVVSISTALFWYLAYLIANIHNRNRPSSSSTCRWLR